MIVADITMPHLNGIDALARLKQFDPGVRVVILTMHRDVSYVRRALDAGALGYVLKHSAASELVTAIDAAMDGSTYVTPALVGPVLKDLKRDSCESRDPVGAFTLRQREILQLLAEGRSAKEIGLALSISARTVEFHKYQMMTALGVHSNAELIHFALKHGMVTI